MDEILEILEANARIPLEDLEKLTGKSKKEIEKAIKDYEKKGIIVKYKAVINKEKMAIPLHGNWRYKIELALRPGADGSYAAGFSLDGMTREKFAAAAIAFFKAATTCACWPSVRAGYKGRLIASA